MPSILSRVLLFLSSYFPLNLIFFFLLWPPNQNRLLAIIFLATGICGIAGLIIYYVVVLAQKAKVQIKVDELQRKDGEVINYIAAYAIPFVVLPIDHIEKILALITFFAVLGILYVQSNMIHINPMLNLIGFHLYDVKLESGSSRFLVTRRSLARGDTPRVVDAGGILFWRG